MSILQRCRPPRVAFGEVLELHVQVNLHAPRMGVGNQSLEILARAVTRVDPFEIGREVIVIDAGRVKRRPQDCADAERLEIGQALAHPFQIAMSIAIAVAETALEDVIDNLIRQHVARRHRFSRGWHRERHEHGGKGGKQLFHCRAFTLGYHRQSEAGTTARQTGQ